MSTQIFLPQSQVYTENFLHEHNIRHNGILHWLCTTAPYGSNWFHPQKFVNIILFTKKDFATLKRCSVSVFSLSLSSAHQLCNNSRRVVHKTCNSPFETFSISPTKCKLESLPQFAQNNETIRVIHILSTRINMLKASHRFHSVRLWHSSR